MDEGKDGIDLSEKLLNRPFKTISEIHEAFDRKLLSPLELTEFFLRRIRMDALGCYLTVCEDRARKSAQAACEVLDREKKVPRDRLPLLGIPLGVKDLICVDGVKTTAGSKILANYISPYTATSVQRLETAGAVILGKTNLDEFGMGSTNEQSAFSPVVHPTHPDRVAGGSSGGSAAAVRAHLCSVALGTDTGGSIRLPASFCGIVGLKPTFGRISRYGQIAYSSSLDQTGPMAHSVEDAALLLEVMSGYDPLDSTSSSLPSFRSPLKHRLQWDWSGVRIGVPREYFVDGLSSEVRQALDQTLNGLKKQGATLHPISLPHTPYAVAVYYLVAVSEASSNLARYDGVRYGERPASAIEARDLTEFYKKSRSNFGEEVKRRILLGTFALSSGYSDAYYKRACQVRRKIQEDFTLAFKQVDLIVGPVCPTTAFRLGEKMHDPLQMYLGDVFTVPVNLAGLPAMSLPCGQDSLGLSIGLQLVAPAFEEDRLVRAADAFFKNSQGDAVVDLG